MKINTSSIYNANISSSPLNKYESSSSSNVKLSSNLKYLSQIPKKCKTAIFKCINDIFKKAKSERGILNSLKRVIQNPNLYFRGLNREEKRFCVEYIKKLISFIDKNIKDTQMTRSYNRYSKLSDELFTYKNNVEYLKNNNKKAANDKGMQTEIKNKNSISKDNSTQSNFDIRLPKDNNTPVIPKFKNVGQAISYTNNMLKFGTSITNNKPNTNDQFWNDPKIDSSGSLLALPVDFNPKNFI